MAIYTVPPVFHTPCRPCVEVKLPGGPPNLDSDPGPPLELTRLAQTLRTVCQVRLVDAFSASEPTDANAHMKGRTSSTKSFQVTADWLQKYQEERSLLWLECFQLPMAMDSNHNDGNSSGLSTMTTASALDAALLEDVGMGAKYAVAHRRRYLAVIVCPDLAAFAARLLVLRRQHPTIVVAMEPHDLSPLVKAVKEAVGAVFRELRNRYRRALSSKANQFVGPWAAKACYAFKTAVAEELAGDGAQAAKSYHAAYMTIVDEGSRAYKTEREFALFGQLVRPCLDTYLCKMLLGMASLGSWREATLFLEGHFDWFLPPAMTLDNRRSFLLSILSPSLTGNQSTLDPLSNNQTSAYPLSNNQTSAYPLAGNQTSPDPRLGERRALHEWRAELYRCFGAVLGQYTPTSLAAAVSAASSSGLGSTGGSGKMLPMHAGQAYILAAHHYIDLLGLLDDAHAPQVEHEDANDRSLVKERLALCLDKAVGYFRYFQQGRQLAWAQFLQQRHFGSQVGPDKGPGLHWPRVREQVLLTWLKDHHYHVGHVDDLGHNDGDRYKDDRVDDGVWRMLWELASLDPVQYGERLAPKLTAKVPPRPVRLPAKPTLLEASLRLAYGSLEVGKPVTCALVLRNHLPQPLRLAGLLVAYHGKTGLQGVPANGLLVPGHGVNVMQWQVLVQTAGPFRVDAVHICLGGANDTGRQEASLQASYDSLDAFLRMDMSTLALIEFDRLLLMQR